MMSKRGYNIESVQYDDFYAFSYNFGDDPLFDGAHPLTARYCMRRDVWMFREQDVVGTGVRRRAGKVLLLPGLPVSHQLLRQRASTPPPEARNRRSTDAPALLKYGTQASSLP
jgi:hypothetical protein